MHVRSGIGLCVLRMLEIFSRGREPEVEGDDSRETAIYFKRWRRSWREPVNVVTPYNNCVPGCWSAHGMHSVKVEAHCVFYVYFACIFFLNGGKENNGEKKIKKKEV